jgi:hypothetical protein
MTNDILNSTIEQAEAILYAWACGEITSKDVHKALRPLGVELVERLNPHGGSTIDAHFEGHGIITLSI